MEVVQMIRVAYLLAHQYMDSLTVQEEEELKKWLETDKRNIHLAEEIRCSHFFVDKQLEEHQYDSQLAFQKVAAKRRRYLIRRRIVRVGMKAAAFLVLALGVFVFLYFQPQKEEISSFSGMIELPAGESRAILTFADGQRMKLTPEMNQAVFEKDGVKLEAGGKAISYQQENTESSSEAYNLLEVPRKGEFKLILADGTQVWINSESSIKYPVDFKGNQRRVWLEGEAYFEVAHNADLPFIVDMGKVTIQVLGTSFNARAYKDENNIVATLAEGKIQLNTEQQKITLNPEYQGIVDLTSGKLLARKVDLELYTAWKSGRFVFQEQSLEEMMNTLSRWYDIQVFFENTSVRNVTFSGDLKRYDHFNKIIEMLEMTGMAHFKVSGNTIFISE